MLNNIIEFLINGLIGGLMALVIIGVILLFSGLSIYPIYERYETYSWGRKIVGCILSFLGGISAAMGVICICLRFFIKVISPLL